MKTSKIICIRLTILLLCGLPMTVNGQSTSPVYMSFSYVKANPGKTGAYIDLIKNYSPKITAERIRQGGGVLGWYMYEVRMPSGSANDYDFVSITATSEFNLLFDELAPPEGTMERILPGISSMTIAGIFEQYESSRTVKRKEVIVPVAGLSSGGVPYKVAWVDFVNVKEGKEKEYLKLQADAVLPACKELQSGGLIGNYRVYKKTLPLDMHSDFDFMVVYFANDIASLADGRLAEAKTKLLANTTSALAASANITRSEIWQLVEYMDIEKSKKP